MFDVVANLRLGNIAPEDIPVQAIVTQEGNTLILNTRSAQALEEAGIQRSEWQIEDVTANPEAQARLAEQLRVNELTSAGAPSEMVWWLPYYPR